MDPTSRSQSLISWQYRTAIKPKVKQIQTLFVRHSFCDQGIFKLFNSVTWWINCERWINSDIIPLCISCSLIVIHFSIEIYPIQQYIGGFKTSMNNLLIRCVQKCQAPSCSDCNLKPYIPWKWPNSWPPSINKRCVWETKWTFIFESHSQHIPCTYGQ